MDAVTDDGGEATPGAATGSNCGAVQGGETTGQGNSNLGPSLREGKETTGKALHTRTLHMNVWLLWACMLCG